MEAIVRAAAQILVIEEARAYVDAIGPTDLNDPGRLAGHLMAAETLLMRIAEAFTESEPTTT
ncbi:hypothetical protein [Streptomyces violaceusniger]|uniref:Uncharacterized protein n=1 Tax=Streptomyces violaceusniger (strain Tu 4113) TaxID=653045 RepID=G2P9J2_STRV4|nr:hypothetical protein [Streptomyces violaceusniger]AEM88312.1 hypothetical protein Strvi_9014 [Streptomyces violaceusniger Tu 4113]